METILLVIFLILLAVMAWGWIRWAKRSQPRNLFAILSLISFSLGTLSGLLAILTFLYALVIRRFPHYDPLLLTIYALGTLLSLSGIVSGIGGLWRSSPVRWHAPICAVGTLLFWLMAAAGE